MKPLVVVGDGLPVFRMRGVAAAGQPLAEQGPAVEIAPARREGREILTARGERVVVKVRESADGAASRTSGLISSATPGKRKAS